MTKEAISSFSFLPPVGYGAASMPGRNCCNKEEIFIIGFLDFAGWQWKDDWWRRGESNPRPKAISEETPDDNE
jgi:hypothetical protein